MIVIKVVRGLTCPTYVCDGCGKDIDTVDRGLAVWNLYGRMLGDISDQSEIKHVHIGECDRRMIDLRTGKRYKFNRSLQRFTDELLMSLTEDTVGG